MRTGIAARSISSALVVGVIGMGDRRFRADALQDRGARARRPRAPGGRQRDAAGDHPGLRWCRPPVHRIPAGVQRRGRGGQTSARVRIVVAACGTALALLGCSVVQVSHNTRYFATQRDAGTTLQLHKGDEVTLNLTITNGRDWTAVSGDVRVAKPAATVIMNFSSGEKARLFDFALVGTGHVELVACPAGSGTCSASTPEALTFDVDVA